MSQAQGTASYLGPWAGWCRGEVRAQLRASSIAGVRCKR